MKWVVVVIALCVVGYAINAPDSKKLEEWNACSSRAFMADPLANNFERETANLPITRMTPEAAIAYSKSLNEAENHRGEFMKSICGERPS